MSEYSLTRWSCDAVECDVQQDEGYKSQPNGWVGVLVVNPPQADRDGAKRKHLCRNCAQKLTDLIGTP